MADETDDIDELKKQKCAEEVKKLRLCNMLASREICHRKQVLEVLAPVMSRMIDDYTTIADELASDLHGQDLGDIHRILREWSVKRLAQHQAALEALISG